jgi:N-acetylmuramoyl-L-alanine amidase
MVFNIHAGHNPDGKIGCGAIGLIKESTESRKVKSEVIRLLRENGHTVYDCTVDNGTSQGNILTKIVNKCNANKVDLDVSIHFNCGANDKQGNNKSTGAEVWLYGTNSKAKTYAESVVKSISELGFKNRGVKYSTSLYFLRKTVNPAMLIECCFVDDKDDVERYDYQSMAKAIVKGLIGFVVEDMDDEIDDCAKEEGSETPTGDRKALYRVQVGAYSVKDNADNLKEKLKKAGFDAVVVKS